jgi:hypothetical protein
VAEAGGRICDQPVGKRLGRLGGEEAGVGVGDLVELGAERREDVGMAMAETGDGRAAGGLDVGASVGIEKLDAFAADGNRQRGVDLAVKDMGHDARLLPGEAECGFGHEAESLGRANSCRTGLAYPARRDRPASRIP